MDTAVTTTQSICEGIDGRGEELHERRLARFCGEKGKGAIGQNTARSDRSDLEVVDGVKLCNNALTSVCGLGPALKPFLLCNLTTTLQWLDLSFNNITSLDGEVRRF